MNDVTTRTPGSPKSERLPLRYAFPIICALAVMGWTIVIGGILLLTGCDPCGLSGLADGGTNGRAQCETSR